MSQSENRIVNGITVRLISIMMWTNIAWIALLQTQNLSKLFRMIKNLIIEKRFIYGEHQIEKLVKTKQGYQFSLNIPPWPSIAFNQYFDFTIKKLLDPSGQDPDAARMVLYAITKKCPLSCEHCYEWDELNKREKITEDEIKETVQFYQRKGASVIWLGGGEPLNRFSAIENTLKAASNHSVFWLSTSGFGLNEKKATTLAENGLTGIIVSLDHTEPDLHNSFRGNSKSFEWVKTAVDTCKKNGLAVGLSLCTVRSVCNESFIHQYMDLAKSWGVGFVQWVEPRAAGRYSGKDVELETSHYNLLDQLYLDYSFEPIYRNHPLISHPSYAQRKIGCGAAGVFNVFIDTEGNKNACPFCRLKPNSELPEIGKCEKFGERIFQEA